MPRFAPFALALAPVALFAACGGNVAVERASGASTGATTTTVTTGTATTTSTATTTTTDPTTTTSITTTSTDTTPVPACECSTLQGFLNGCGYPAPADCAGFPEADCVCASMESGCTSMLANCFDVGVGGSSPGEPGLPVACRKCFVKAVQGACALELDACKQNPECQAELDCHKECQYTAACNAACDAAHPKGAQAYAALVMCADCIECEAECEATDLFETYCVYAAP